MFFLILNKGIPQSCSLVAYRLIVYKQKMIFFLSEILIIFSPAKYLKEFLEASFNSSLFQVRLHQINSHVLITNVGNETFHYNISFNIDQCLHRFVL